MAGVLLGLRGEMIAGRRVVQGRRGGYSVFTNEIKPNANEGKLHEQAAAGFTTTM
jgi:hypothetical protein